MWLVLCILQELPIKPRPLYSMTMDKLILCFSGFKVKEHLVRFCVNKLSFIMTYSVRAFEETSHTSVKC